MTDLPCNCTDTAFCERHLPRSRSGKALAPRLTPEEQAVVEAAKAWARDNQKHVYTRPVDTTHELLSAVEALQEVEGE